ncbi:MAG: RsmE family RNA methyltransferase [Actinomycetota bacterium]
MSYPYFFINPDSIDGENIVLAGDDFNHLVKVLRAQVGSRVMLSDNKSLRYEADLAAVKKNHALLSVVSRQKIERSFPQATLFQCILKKAAMELVLQKACEIGADTIVPVISGRVVVDPGRVGSKIGRWQKIAEQACKQSKRNFITTVAEPADIKTVSPSGYSLFYLPYEESSRDLLLGNGQSHKSIAVLTGPEGGFERQEVELLKKKGAAAVSLAKNILRAETASLYMLSVIDYFYRKKNG